MLDQDDDDDDDFTNGPKIPDCRNEEFYFLLPFIIGFGLNIGWSSLVVMILENKYKIIGVDITTQKHEPIEDRNYWVYDTMPLWVIMIILSIYFYEEKKYQAARVHSLLTITNDIQNLIETTFLCYSRKDNAMLTLNDEKMSKIEIFYSSGLMYELIAIYIISYMLLIKQLLQKKCNMTVALQYVNYITKNKLGYTDTIPTEFQTNQSIGNRNYSNSLLDIGIKRLELMAFNSKIATSDIDLNTIVMNANFEKLNTCVILHNYNELFGLLNKIKTKNTNILTTSPYSSWSWIYYGTRILSVLFIFTLPLLLWPTEGTWLTVVICSLVYIFFGGLVFYTIWMGDVIGNPTKYDVLPIYKKIGSTAKYSDEQFLKYFSKATPKIVPMFYQTTASFFNSKNSSKLI